MYVWIFIAIEFYTYKFKYLSHKNIFIPKEKVYHLLSSIIQVSNNLLLLLFFLS